MIHSRRELVTNYKQSNDEPSELFEKLNLRSSELQNLKEISMTSVAIKNNLFRREK